MYGALLKVTPALSVFAIYSQSLEPQLGADADGGDPGRSGRVAWRPQGARRGGSEGWRRPQGTKPDTLGLDLIRTPSQLSGDP